MFRAPLAVLALAISALALAGTVDADPRFNPSFEVSLTNPAPQSPSDLRLSFRLGSGPQMATTVMYIPRDWGIVPGDQIPVGTKMGFIDSIETFGLINSTCSNAVSWRFELLNASLDPGRTVSLYDEQALNSNAEAFGPFEFADDKDQNGLVDAVDHYPDFLDAALKGERPLVRLAGVSELAGVPHLRQLLIFAPDAHLNVPDAKITESVAGAGVSGYPVVLVNEDFRSLDGAQHPSPITDSCTSSEFTVVLGPVDNGPWLLVNPQDAVYGFTLVSVSKRDADGDGYENSIDTCPLQPSAGSPVVLNDGDADADGIDRACDPIDDPLNRGSNSDEDADGLLNRQDNCPLAANGIDWNPTAAINPSTQSDEDFDDIGDVCDPNPQSPDGEALVSMKTANVVVGAASGSGGPPSAAACPECFRPDGTATAEKGDGGGQLAVAAGLIALGAGAGAVVIGGGALYILRRRRL